MEQLNSISVGGGEEASDVLCHFYGQLVLLFSSFMPIVHGTVNTYESKHNAKAYEVLSDIHKYFIFGRYICSFTSLIT